MTTLRERVGGSGARWEDLRALLLERNVCPDGLWARLVMAYDAGPADFPRCPTSVWMIPTPDRAVWVMPTDVIQVTDRPEYAGE